MHNMLMGFDGGFLYIPDSEDTAKKHHFRVGILTTTDVMC